MACWSIIEKTLQAIVGIEIPVQCIEGKWKLSQNRTAEDQAGVRAGLNASADEQARAVAQWMEKPASHW